MSPSTVASPSQWKSDPEAGFTRAVGALAVPPCRVGPSVLPVWTTMVLLTRGVSAGRE
ncbi:hypothetical protein [Nonomuraea sp. NPDC050691]|uniref:hypothetical protein n=1 Tax=Nonomuraea sp. NPDC050691 TaxID=3155661 RepID=UPI0033FA4DD1